MTIRAAVVPEEVEQQSSYGIVEKREKAESYRERLGRLASVMPARRQAGPSSPVGTRGQLMVMRGAADLDEYGFIRKRVRRSLARLSLPAEARPGCSQS